MKKKTYATSRAAGPLPGHRNPVICTAFLPMLSALLLRSKSCPVNRSSLMTPFDRVLYDSAQPQEDCSSVKFTIGTCMK